MPLLPRPYPDEVIGSVIERGCYQSGLSVKLMVRSLFGPSRSHLSFLMASKLPELGRNMGIDAEELLTLHTMFPYAVAFMPRSEHSKQKSKALRLAENECIGSVTKNVSHGVPMRRFCPHCLSEDLRLYGESYWRRSHLLPGVFICTQHRTELVETEVRLKDNVLFRTVVLPQNATTLSRPIPVCDSISRTLHETSLMALHARMELQENWPRVYKQKALDKGYQMRGGDVAARRLADDLCAFYGPELLRVTGCEFPSSGRQPWPSLMIRAGLAQNYATAKHVLFHTFFRLAADAALEFGYEKPGKKDLDFEKLDAHGLVKLKAFVNAHLPSGRRFTVEEVLREVGIWQSFRHHRNRYPLIAEWLAVFKASDQSARQTGLRPYWRTRLRSRCVSKTSSG
jgi:hypothetical protein